MGILDVALALAPDRMGCENIGGGTGTMGCGNVGGGTGTRQNGVWECWGWHWHLTGRGVGMLEGALAPGRIGCGNAGGSAGTGTWQDGVWECWR